MANLRDANILQDFTVWVAGDGKVGTSPSFQPPEIKIQTEDFRGGGMDGTVEVPLGIEKIEFDFDLHTWDEQVWQNLGFGPGSMNVPINFRGYLLSPDGAEKGVRIETHSLLKEIKVNKIEPGKKVEMTCSCVASKYKHYVEGAGGPKVLTEIDVFAKIFVINGQDKSAAGRRFLGLTY